MNKKESIFMEWLCWLIVDYYYVIEPKANYKKISLTRIYFSTKRKKSPNEFVFFFLQGIISAFKCG